jgi:hypothetical protein
MVELTDFLQAATLRGGFFYPLMMRFESGSFHL